MPDVCSARWCEICQLFGDHHTDRHGLHMQYILNEHRAAWVLVRENYGIDSADDLVGHIQQAVQNAYERGRQEGVKDAVSSYLNGGR